MTLVLTACSATVHLPPTPSPPPGPPAAPDFRAGFGRGDITPPPGPGLFGYGPEGRPAEGFRQRLHARALVVEDVRGERLALVTVELGAVPTLLHRRVAEVLARRHPDALGLGSDRIFLVATHTHAGPGNVMGGYFDRRASQVGGHDPALVELLVDGIVAAIEAAHLDRSPAALAWGTAPAWGFTRNRSFLPYQANTPPATSAFPPPDHLPVAARAVDPELWVVRVDHRSPDGTLRPRGALVMFPIHGTAVPSANALYDADLHGVVARAVEAHIEGAMGRGPSLRPRAVALFAGGAGGDLSPAVSPSTRCAVARKRRGVPTPLAALLPTSSLGWVEPDPEVREACLEGAIEEMEALGAALAAEATALFDRLAGAGRPVTVARSTSTLVPSEEAGLCAVPQVGSATPGGVADGVTRLSGVMGIREGRIDPGSGGCQAPKVPFLGALQRLVAPVADHPGPAPFGVIRLGDLLVGTVPGEATFTAGARMRGAMAASAAARGFDPGAVALLTLTNGYLYYAATREEYGFQYYEGSSTLHGPGQAEAFARRLARLAEAMTPEGTSTPAEVPALEFRTPRPSSLLPPSRLVEPAAPGLVLGCDGGGRLVARWMGLDPARQLPRPGPWVEVVQVADGLRVGWDGHPGVEIRVEEVRPEGTLWGLRFLQGESGVAYRVRLAEGAMAEHRCGPPADGTPGDPAQGDRETPGP